MRYNAGRTGRQKRSRKKDRLNNNEYFNIWIDKIIHKKDFEF